MKPIFRPLRDATMLCLCLLLWCAGCSGPGWEHFSGGQGLYEPVQASAGPKGESEGTSLPSADGSMTTQRLATGPVVRPNPPRQRGSRVPQTPSAEFRAIPSDPKPLDSPFDLASPNRSQRFEPFWLTNAADAPAEG